MNKNRLKNLSIGLIITTINLLLVVLSISTIAISYKNAANYLLLSKAISSIDHLIFILVKMGVIIGGCLLIFTFNCEKLKKLIVDGPTS